METNKQHVVKYKEVVKSLLDKIVEDEYENIEKAADLCVNSILHDGFIYIFGTGHSMLMAFEMFYRAGGLVRIFPIIDPNLLGLSGAGLASRLERLSGYASLLLDYYNPKPGSTLIIVSQSGKNAVPVEMAFEAKKRGLNTIAITSVSYSMKLAPESPIGKRLFEVADIVIDNKVPEGEVGYEVGGYKVAAVSTMINAFILHSLEILVISKLIAMGVEPEVWVSHNIPGGADHNRKYVEKFKGIIKYL